MGLMNNGFKYYMNEPVTHEVTAEEIIDFYCRCGNKKQTAAVYCITIKELNDILKGTKAEKKIRDPYKDLGMSRRDF